MTAKTALNPNTPASPTASPRSSILPKIGSAPVTGVSNGQSSPEKNSADAMQAVQRKQTQPATAAALSPSRMNTSAADDLSDLLEEALKETGMPEATPSSSTSSVQPVAAPSLDSAQIAAFDLQKVLVSVGAMASEALISVIMPIPIGEKVQAGQDVKKILGMINPFFKSLLDHSDNPGPWLEQESQTPFYRKFHPFAASYFLVTYLDHAAGVKPYLEPAQVAEWKSNYQKCVALLKRHGLDGYNETEFPFSGFYKHSYEHVKEMRQLITQDPHGVDELRSAAQSLPQNPHEMMQEMAHDPELAALMEMGMQDMGIDPAEMEALMKDQTRLEEMLSRSPQMAQSATSSSAPGAEHMGSEVDTKVAEIVAFINEQVQLGKMASRPPEMAQRATSSSVPKKALSDKERFENEIVFFRNMVLKNDKTVDQWLKENSPESDYPLLWAKKRTSQLSRFRDTVAIDLRREWKMCADTCLERVPNTVHVDLGQIPADASPELKAFLAQG